MKNYTIANKNLDMRNLWWYALSVEGREAFEKGDKMTRIEILTQLLNNGNITMPKMLDIMSRQVN